MEGNIKKETETKNKQLPSLQDSIKTLSILKPRVYLIVIHEAGTIE